MFPLDAPRIWTWKRTKLACCSEEFFISSVQYFKCNGNNIWKFDFWLVQSNFWQHDMARWIWNPNFWKTLPSKLEQAWHAQGSAQNLPFSENIRTRMVFELIFKFRFWLAFQSNLAILTARCGLTMQRCFSFGSFWLLQVWSRAVYAGGKQYSATFFFKRAVARILLGFIHANVQCIMQDISNARVHMCKQHTNIRYIFM